MRLPSVLLPSAQLQVAGVPGRHSRRCHAAAAQFTMPGRLHAATRQHPHCHQHHSCPTRRGSSRCAAALQAAAVAALLAAWSRSSRCV